MKRVRTSRPALRQVQLDAVHGGGTPLPAIILEGTPLPAITVNPALVVAGTPLPAIIIGGIGNVP